MCSGGSCQEDGPLKLHSVFVSNSSVLDEMRRLLGGGGGAGDAAARPTSSFGSYCHLLQEVDASVGIEAEVVRTLGSSNGLGAMLSDHVSLEARLRAGTASQVRHVCLASVTPGAEGANEHWRELTEPLGCSEVDAVVEERHVGRHGTSIKAFWQFEETRDELRQMAQRALAARLSARQHEISEQLAAQCRIEWGKGRAVAESRGRYRLATHAEDAGG